MSLPEQVPGAERSQFALLGTRRFLPFFSTQFLGAFNDNLFRNALLVTLVYGAAAADLPGNHSMLPNLAVALFILPFFLFSAPVHGKDASATGLQKIVAGLRADWQ